MSNESEEGHKYPPNQAVESQNQCELLKNEEMDTLQKRVLTSGRLALHQYSIDISGTRRMEDYASGLRSSIYKGTN